MPAVYMVNSVTSMLMIKMMKKIRKKEEDPEEKQGKEEYLNRHIYTCYSRLLTAGHNTTSVLCERSFTMLV